jgi:Transposase DDE domain group 1
MLAYNLENFLRRLALPTKVKHWSLRSLLVKLIKIGAKVVRSGRYTTFSDDGGGGIQGCIRENPGPDQPITMLHSVIVLWFSKIEGQVRPTAVLREKTLVFHARKRYAWPLQQGFWRSQKVESSFSRARCPDSRFQRLIWGISVKTLILSRWI